MHSEKRMNERRTAIIWLGWREGASMMPIARTVHKARLPYFLTFVTMARFSRTSGLSFLKGLSRNKTLHF
jgi:hypothetical protein